LQLTILRPIRQGSGLAKLRVNRTKFVSRKWSFESTFAKAMADLRFLVLSFELEGGIVAEIEQMRNCCRPDD